MTTNWRDSVCRSSAPASITDIRQYVSALDGQQRSPIDEFYIAVQNLLLLAAPQLLNEHKPLGGLVTVGLVSATENYFRDLFAQIIRICPLAQTKSSGQTVHLGSVVWHRSGYVERGAFEHLSLAGEKNIKESCEKFVDYRLKSKGATANVLVEFDKVCEIRHGIVHSNSFLAGKNALKLKLGYTSKTLGINMNYANIQESAMICSTLVSSFNRELFEEMAKRWASEWPKFKPLTSDEKVRLFRQLWVLFKSQIDAKRKFIPKELTMGKCMEEISSEWA